MKYQVGVIAGDGIGPEIVAEAQKVLNCVADKFGHEFEYEDILMGGCSIDADRRAADRFMPLNRHCTLMQF